MAHYDFISQEGFSMANEEAAKVVEEVGAESGAAKKKTKTTRHMSEEAKKKMVASRKETQKRAENMVPDVYIQYQDWERNVGEIVEDAKAAFLQEKKRGLITSMQVYVKPEEHAAYYVINNDKTGKLEY